MAEPASPVPGPARRLLFLHAQTPLHPGDPAADALDRRVRREAHTGWPTIAAATLMRALGAGDPSASEEPPVTDARLLAFPVRSLRGVFAWVTCAAVLHRLQRDLGTAGLPPLPAAALAEPERDHALCADSSPLRVDGNRLVLEEFEFTCTGTADEAARWIARQAVGDAPTRQRLLSHLVVLQDDDFTHFARHATELVARTTHDPVTRTLRPGPAVQEEFLPAETLFYAVVHAADRLAPLTDGTLVQLGGGATTGKGLCLVRRDTGGEDHDQAARDQ